MARKTPDRTDNFKREFPILNFFLQKIASGKIEKKAVENPLNVDENWRYIDSHLWQFAIGYGCVAGVYPIKLRTDNGVSSHCNTWTTWTFMMDNGIGRKLIQQKQMQ